ncbi:MipA/OmpV family protein [Sphingomonas sp. GCM10030256]|uniref:MipA/OmpV family protein n=1 Tax=Sphingomonas sp. GCM10030256 TaxID=3273427 RepID=UPI00360E596E
MTRILTAAFLAAVAIATPALAQSPTPDQPPLLPDVQAPTEYLSIGLGAGITADYEGSDEYRIIPGAILRAKTNGISISSRGTYLYADVIDTGRKVDFDAGPIIGVRLNRTGKIKDDLVDRLDDRKVAFEVGGFGGVSIKAITNPYDSLSFRMDAVKDVGNAHESWVFTPSVDFGTPLSLQTFVGASVSADFTSDKYARYYFGIDADDALASGLPLYTPEGGMKSWQLSLLASQSLSGDLRKGWALFGTGSFKRLVGDFKGSPIVADRGSATNWFGAVGVGYSW